MMDEGSERNVISITDEDGVEYELEVLASVTYQDAEYLALTPADADEDAEELEVSILKSVTEDGEPMLITVDDEKELEAVYDLLMDEIYDETDPEEDAD